MTVTSLELERAVRQVPRIPRISVVVPVYNSAAMLERCLAALARSRDVDWECIVVDDGSSDDSVEVAHRWGARVVPSGRVAGGPGHARNVGAREAKAPLLCFLDADVEVTPGVLARFVAMFEEDPELAAAFGSYDTAPGASGMLSQYRNLLHHFVHQQGHEDASTFWSGCGAIWRSVFLGMGGFDPSYTRPSIEDIELGYRLRAAGLRIRLAKDIQVKHLKRWTFWGILKTDVCDRALPWTALILRTGFLPNDLNVNMAGRLSALSVYALGGLALLGFWQPGAWLAALVPLLALLLCNQALYVFFLRKRGPLFLLQALVMHWLYFGYSVLAFVAGVLLFRWSQLFGGLSGGAGAPSTEVFQRRGAAIKKEDAL